MGLIPQRPMRRRLHRAALIAASTCVLGCSVALAGVARVQISSRADVTSPGSAPTAIAYEKLVGTVYYALDPADPHNRAIIDLDKAPRNANGRVEFSADLEVLMPKDAARGNDVAYFDVLNRGRRTRDDEFLMSRGYTLVRVGWQFDARRVGLMGLTAPPVLEHGRQATGRVTTLLLPGSRDEVYALDDIGRYADASLYPPLDPASAANRLTVRAGFLAEPRVVPRDAWQFAAGASRLVLEGGFRPGHVYELSYEAGGAVVAGVGFAALRDLASAVKHGRAGPIRTRYAYALGNSQDGRWLREFLYNGFNADEQDLRVFDGIIANIAGSARSADFNGRFARPSGLAYYTASLFPYLDLDQKDPVTGRIDGIQMHLAPAQRPKIFYTDSSTEYWGGGRAAALTHTSLDGLADVAEAPNVRIYQFAGTQHGASAPRTPAAEAGAQPPNDNDYSWAMHALLVDLDRWVREDLAPPPSAHPRLADGSLVPLPKLRFPAIPGVKPPFTIPAGYRADLPGPLAAHRLPMLVPQVDADGNETAGIRLPMQAVPLATYTGWAFRPPSMGQPDEVMPLAGTAVPLPLTRAERERNHDPRLSIEERYGTRERYRQQLVDAAARLVRDRFLLEDEAPRVIELALANWDARVRGSSLAGK